MGLENQYVCNLIKQSIPVCEERDDIIGILPILPWFGNKCGFTVYGNTYFFSCDDTTLSFKSDFVSSFITSSVKGKLEVFENKEQLVIKSIRNSGGEDNVFRPDEFCIDYRNRTVYYHYFIRETEWVIDQGEDYPCGERERKIEESIQFSLGELGEKDFEEIKKANFHKDILISFFNKNSGIYFIDENCILFKKNFSNNPSEKNQLQYEAVNTYYESRNHTVVESICGMYKIDRFFAQDNRIIQIKVFAGDLLKEEVLYSENIASEYGYEYVKTTFQYNGQKLYSCSKKNHLGEIMSSYELEIENKLPSRLRVVKTRGKIEHYFFHFEISKNLFSIISYDEVSGR